MHVDDPGLDALGGQGLGGLHGLLDHEAHGDDGNVAAIPEGDALAQLEGIAGQVPGQVLHGGAAQAQVGGAVIVHEGLDGGLHLGAVAGAAHHHAGDGPHDGHILTGLVGGAVLAHGEAAVGAHHRHVEVGVGDGVADLLKGTAGGKDGKAVGKGLLAGGCQTGGHGHHIALGDAHVEEPVGVGLGKALGHGGAGEVGVQNHQVGVLSAQLYERVAVGGAGGDLLSHLTSPPIPPDRH